MFALLLGMSMFGVAITDIGNDNPEWEYVGAQECIPGYKKSGFSFTIGKKVFFKQKNIARKECLLLPFRALAKIFKKINE